MGSRYRNSFEGIMNIGGAQIGMPFHKWIKKHHLRTQKNTNFFIMIELVMTLIAQTILTPQTAEWRMIYLN